MLMRVVALVVVVWSFVGMPLLCRAGVLVDCCASEVAGHEKPDAAPDKCPNHCPCDTREDSSDETDSSEPRSCGACAELCHVVSPHSKQAGGDDLTVMLVASITVTPLRFGVLLPHQNRPFNWSTQQLREHLPYPVSDRPLLT